VAELAALLQIHPDHLCQPSPYLSCPDVWAKQGYRNVIHKSSKPITELSMADIREPVPLTYEQIEAVAGGCPEGDLVCAGVDFFFPESTGACDKAHDAIHRIISDSEYQDLNNNQMCDAGDHYPES
jgi:hypothetical protein